MMEKSRVARKEWPGVARIVVFLNVVCGAGGCFLFWHIANGPWVEARAGFLEWVQWVGAGVADHIGWGFGLVATIQFACLIAIIGGQINVGDNEEEASMREVLNALAVFPLALIAPAMCVLVVGATGDARLAGVLMVAAPVFLLLSVISVYVGTFEPANELVLERLSGERVKLARNKQRIFDAQMSTGPVRAGLVAWAAVTGFVVAGAIVVGLFRDSLMLEGREVVLVGTLIYIAAIVVPYWVGATIHLIAVLKWSAGFFDWLVVGLAGLMYLALGLLAILAAWIAAPSFGFLVGGTVVILGAISVESFHGARGNHASRNRDYSRWRGGGVLGLAATRVAQRNTARNLRGAEKLHNFRKVAADRIRADMSEEAETMKGSWGRQCRDAAEVLRRASALIEHLPEGEGLQGAAENRRRSTARKRGSWSSTTSPTVLGSTLKCRWTSIFRKMGI